MALNKNKNKNLQVLFSVRMLLFGGYSIGQFFGSSKIKYINGYSHMGVTYHLSHGKIN